MGIKSVGYKISHRISRREHASNKSYLNLREGLPFSLGKMLSVKILLLLQTENRERRKIDFIGNRTSTPFSVGKSALEFVCLSKDLLLHSFSKWLNFATFLKHF